MRRVFVRACALSVPDLTAAAATAAVATAGAANPGAYAFVQEIVVPGDGGWDYLSIDARARRLYVTHGDHIDVIDIDRNALVGRIADTAGVHGFAIAGELARGYASDGGASQVSIVDLNTQQTLATVATGANPDAIVFEPSQRQVYAFNGRAQSATVFDARSGEVLDTIALPGKPEFAVADPAAGRIYDNIEDQNLVVAIDAATHAIVARWPIAPGESASGMALDTAHHRLFIGCRNQRMVMLDTRNGRVLASLPIGSGVDANAFDPGTQLAFSANGEGTVSIAREQSPDRLAPVQTLPTRPGARTMALDPISHRIYLASATLSAAPEASPHARPVPVPGSFRILVYGPIAAQ